MKSIIWYTAIVSFYLSITAIFAPYLIVAQEDASSILEANFSASNTTPLVGEPFDLKLSFVLPENHEVVEWPDLSETSEFFEIVTTQEVQSTDLENGQTLYSQEFVGRLWKPDDYSTPETYIIYQKNGADEERSILVSSLRFTVPSVLDRGDLTLRPPQPPIGFFYLPTWAIILITLTIVGLGYKLKITLKERRKGHSLATPLIDPFSRAKSQLLDVANLTTYSEQLAAIHSTIRDYLYHQFAIDNYSSTPSEIMSELISNHEPRNSPLFSLVKLLYYINQLRFNGTEIDDETISNITNQTYLYVESTYLDAENGEIA